MKPFDNFCQSLFASRNSWRKVLVEALEARGQALGSSTPSDEEARDLVESLPEAVLLELLYRFAYYYSANVFTTLAQYKNAHPERTQFVNEFLQNADDAGASRVVFEFTPTEVRVHNNGQAFTHENLYAICSFNESDKGPGAHQQIGKFGMGFKTVFRVSHSPRVHTWDRERGFRFAFRFFEPGGLSETYHRELASRHALDTSAHVSPQAARDHHRRVGYILPEPVDAWDDQLCGAYLAEDAHGSAFSLPLRWVEGDEQFRQWNQASIDSLVPADVFLFLQNVRELRLVERRQEGDRERVYRKETETRPVAELHGGRIERLRFSVDGGSAESWLLYRSAPQVMDPEAYTDLDQWVRSRLPRQVSWTIAAKLGPCGEAVGFVGEPQLLGGKVYAFLPVKNPRLGLNVHVNAPFNLTNNRADLSPDRFNQELIGKIAKSTRQLLDWMSKRDRADSFHASMYRLLPHQEEGTEALAPVREAASAFRDEQPYFPAHDGTLARPDEVVTVENPTLWKLAAEVLGGRPICWLEESRPPDLTCKIVLDAFCGGDITQPSRMLHELLRKAQVTELRLDTLLRFLGNPDALRERSKEGLDWYESLRKLISHIPSNNDTKQRLQRCAFLPTAGKDGPLTSPDKAILWTGTDDDRDLVLMLWPNSPILHPKVKCWGGQDRQVSSFRSTAVDELFRDPDGPRAIDLLRVLARSLDRQPLQKCERSRLREALRFWSVVPASDDPSHDRQQVSASECTVAAKADRYPDELRHHLRVLAESEYPEENRPLLAQLVSDEGDGPSLDLTLSALEGMSAPSPALVAWALDLLARTLAGTSKGKQEAKARAAAAIRLKPANRQTHELAEDLALRAFPEALPTTTLGRLLPKAAGVDLAHYVGAVGQTEQEVAQRLMETLALAREHEPRPEPLIEAAQLVRDGTEGRTLIRYLAALARSRWPSNHRDRLAYVAHRLSATAWLPALDMADLQPPKDVLLVDPGDSTGVGGALYRQRIPALDLGTREQEALLRDAREAAEAGLLRFRAAPSREDLTTVVGRLLDEAGQPGEAGRQAWLDLATLRASFAEGDAMVRAALLARDARLPRYALSTGNSVWLAPGADEAERTVVVPDGLSREVAEALLGSEADVLLEPEEPLRELLGSGFGVPLFEVVDGRPDLHGDPDLACRGLRALGKKKGDRTLDDRDLDAASAAVSVLCKVDRHRRWFGEQERVIPTWAGTMVAAEEVVYRGKHPLVGRILGHKDRQGHRLHRGLVDVGGACTVLGVKDDEGYGVGPGKGIGVESQLPVKADLEAACDEAFLELVQNRLPDDRKSDLADGPLAPGEAHFAEEIKRDLLLEVGGRKPLRWTDTLEADFRDMDGTRHYYLSRDLELTWRKELARRSEDRAAVERERERERRHGEVEDARREIEDLREDGLHDLASQIQSVMPQDRELRERIRKARKGERGLRSIERQLVAERYLGPLRRRHITERGYTTTACIFRELLQNVEDAYASQPQDDRPKAPWARLVFEDRSVRLVHAGRPFNGLDTEGKTRNDVACLLALGGSEKEEMKSQIGRFGLGFKSVFRVYDEVLVLSHPYHFTISSIVLPRWFERFFDRLYDNKKGVFRGTDTEFEFRRPRKEVEQEHQQLCADAKSGRAIPVAYLLFLDHVEQVDVERWPSSGEKVKHQLRRRVAGGEVPSISGAETTTERVELKQDRQGEPAARVPGAGTYLRIRSRKRIDFSALGLASRADAQYGIAVKLRSDGQGVEPVPESMRKVFLYLPTSEAHGFKFAVHGAFATDTGREGIGSGEAFEGNRELGKALGELLQATFTGLFAHYTSREARRTLYGLVPRARQEGEPEHVLDPLRDAFPALLDQGKKLLLTRAGKLVDRNTMARGGKHLVGVYEAVRERWKGAPEVHFLDQAAADALDRVGDEGGYWVPHRLTERLFQSCTPAQAGTVLLAMAAYHQDQEGVSSGDHNYRQERDALVRALAGTRCVPCTGGLSAPDDALLVEERLQGLVASDRQVDQRHLPVDDGAFQWLDENLKFSCQLNPDEVVATAQTVLDKNGSRGDDLLFHLSDHWSRYRSQTQVIPHVREVAEMLDANGELRTLLDELDGGLVKALFPEWFTRQSSPQPASTVHDPGDEEKREAIRTIQEHWSQVRPEDRRQYTLSGYAKVFGLSSEPDPDARLCQVLKEGDEAAQRAWFKVLAICSVIQTGHRMSEGAEFLNHFNDRGYFDRLFEADSTPAFHGIVKETLDRYFKDRWGEEREWTYYWRLLYDFEKARQLIQHWDLVPKLHEVAKERPAEITGFLRDGKLPGERASQKGLGMSMGKQALFVVREMLRLGVWGREEEQARALREAAYYPSRHTRRLVSRCRLLDGFEDPERSLNLDQLYGFSSALAALVECAGVEDHFDDHFDVALMHYAANRCAGCTGQPPCDLPCSKAQPSGDELIRQLVADRRRKTRL